MSTGDLKRTLMDVRKMRRAVRMRRETDPEVVSQTLETILHEAIALSTTEDGAMSRAAIKELRQVRRSMMAGQINAGQNTARHIGAFSAVLDQIDQTASEAKQEAEAERSQYRSSLLENLPSSDTMISAIMTANPLFGYTLKMGRDLTQSIKKNNEDRKSREKREMELRRQRLMEQENVLKQQLITDEAVRDNAEEEKKQLTQRSRGIYRTVLEEIRDEISSLTQKLNQVESSDTVESETSQLELIHDTNEETVEQLERIHETDKEQIRLERQRQDIASLQAEEAGIEGRSDAVFGESVAPGDNKKDFDLLGGLFSGNMKGLLGSLIVPFTSMFGFLKTAGAMLLKFGRFGGVLTAVKMIYDFVDGIFNASKILGREDLDIGDRLKVGISNILSGLLEPLDWVSEKLFGEGLMGGRSREDWTRQYFEFFDNFTENMFGMAEWIGESIMNMFSSVFDSAVDKIKEYLPDWMLGDDDEQTIDDNDRERLNHFRQGGQLEPDADARQNLEEMPSPASLASLQAASAAEMWDMNTLMGGYGNGGGNPVFAPNSSQTNINQHQYMGGGTSENREPTHRRFTMYNQLLSNGNL